MTPEEREFAEPKAVLIQSQSGEWVSYSGGGKFSMHGCTLHYQAPRSIIAYLLKAAFKELLRDPLGLERRRSRR